MIEQLAEQAREEEIYQNDNFPPSLYYRFLKLLAAWKKPALSVELGVCGGGGSLHLAQGFPFGSVVGIDIVNDYPENIKHIEEHFENFEFMIGDSKELAKVVNDKYGKAGLLFVDTDHTYQNTLDEWNAWYPYLEKNAIVCFDDMFRPGVKEAWDTFPGEKFRFDYLHVGGEPTDGGFGVIQL